MAGHNAQSLRDFRFDAEFILSRVKVVGDCWEWQGAVSSSGYGNILDNAIRRTYKAHRAAYRVFVDDPGDKLVLHRCDNRTCCNPAHLFLGTNEDNMRDMALKGRGKGHPGASNPNAKLTQQQIDEIKRTPRRSLPGGASNGALAIRYGVCSESIARLRRGLIGKYAKEVQRGSR